VKGLHYVMSGTSGGIWGAERGYCQMIGASNLSSGAGSHFLPRWRRRWTRHRARRPEQASGTAEHGYLHCGPSGAGHFVKMVHNGIEYGIMRRTPGPEYSPPRNIGKVERHADAETAPLRNPSTISMT